MSLPGWVDVFIGRLMRFGGVALTRRSAINFGTGFEVVDDPANDQHTVNVTGGGGSGTGALIVSTQTALKNLHAVDLLDGQQATVKATNRRWTWASTAGAGMPGDDSQITKLTETLTANAGRFIASDVFVPVTWFGADPSGAIDSATAFTNAVNTARHVIVPPGNYALAGWSVPRPGVTIELLDGAQLDISDTIVTNKTNVRWIGQARGHNFNSDGLATWRPNIVCQTGMAGKTAMRFAGGATADGGFLDGIMVDGNAIAAVTAYRIGTTGFGASGYQWINFSALDCDKGLILEAAVEESGFHCPYLGFRTGSLGLGTLGVGIGYDANYDGGITATVVGDHGGTVSGFTKGIQLGGPAGRVGTVRIGGDSPLTVETIRTSGAVGVEFYDTHACSVEKIHCELHGMLITGATNANPTVIQTVLPHGLTNGTTVKISNVLGNTGANTSAVVTVVDSDHFSIPVDTTAGGTYTGGGIVSDMTHRNIVVGHAGTAPIWVRIDDNYLAGAQYGIELIGFIQLEIGGTNEFELSASGDGSHLPYAIKNTGGGSNRTEGKIPSFIQTQRGTFYGGDVSDGTGLTAYDVSDRDANNEPVPRRFFDGTYESPTLRDPRVTKDLVLGLQYTVTAVSNTTPVELTFSTTTKLRTGDPVRVLGTGIGALDLHDFTVTRTASNKVTLDGSTAAGTASSGTVISESLFKILECVGFDVTMNDGYNLVFKQSAGTPFAFTSKDAASAGLTSTVPLGFFTNGFVWNGAASVTKSFGWSPVITAPNPFQAYFDGQIAGVSRFAFDSDGQIWPAGHGAFRVVYSTGAAPNSAAPDGGDWAVGDTWVRTDVSPGGISRWRCTTGGHTGTVVWKAEATLAA